MPTISPQTLFDTLDSRLANICSPITHSLAAIAHQILFITPERISRTFPTIKIKATSSNAHDFSIDALLDSGATATYVSHSFVENHNLPTRSLNHPLYVYNADDTLNKLSIDREAQFTITIQGHKSVEWFYVTELGTKDMVIGMTWLRSHNPEINWRSGEITFTRCPRKCHGEAPTSHSLQTLFESGRVDEQLTVNLMVHRINAKTSPSIQLALENFKNKEVLTLDDIKTGPFADYLDIFEDQQYQALPPHRKWDHKIDLAPDWESRIWKPRIYPLDYEEQKIQDEFLKENLANGRIRVSESPLASPLFMIDKKEIDPKTGKAKKRLVIDYRKLNELTVKNAYPLPLTDELINKWNGCKYFSALDVRNGYYNIRIREGDEWKTAFITNRGLYESLVMTFGLTNAPATFQTMMDSIFVVYIRRGDTGAFIDDIGIGTKSDPTGKLSDEEFHIKVCREILQVFREHHLSLKVEKCLFLRKEIPYLGHIVSGSSIRPDPVKVEGVGNWPVPTTLKQLRSFLGFVNYYRRFIFNFSHIARPLHDLLRKDVTWKWEKEQQEAYEVLKAAMLSAPVLAHPDPTKQFLLETDASNVAYGAVLSQQQEDDKWHPVAFLSRSLAPAERNYHTRDRELLAIVKALEEWRHLLQRTLHEVIVLTDHANLTHFKNDQKLNARQARWALFLENFDLSIRYRPGRQSSVPDSLSRRADHGDSNSQEENRNTQLLPDRFFPQDPSPPSNINAVAHSPPPPSSLEHDLYVAQCQDPLIQKFNMLKEGQPQPSNWKRDRGGSELWAYWGKIYVPEVLRQTIFRLLHSDPSAGHPGRDGTLYSIRRNYYWPGLQNDVIEWVRNCDICQRTKVYPKKPHGELKPVDPVPRFWGVVTSDLITGLPPCKGFNAIWTATDKRGKMVHIAPTTDTLDSEGLAHLFLERVWRLHGTADKLITDRGPQFASRFAKDLNRNLQIETALSTAYHPQTDGQSERTNQDVEQALRTVVNYHQDDWVDWLPVIEFALNNRYKRALKTTPFYANYGYHPQIGSLPRIDTPIVSVENFVSHLQQVQKDTEKALVQAAEDMKRFYDKHRGKTPEFEIGQKVLLDNADLAINRPSRKLAERRSGPFKILARIGTHAYRLELPLQWKNVHPVFHVSKLEAYREDPEQPNFPVPPPDIVEGEPEWEVEEILDAKFLHNRLYFLVKWLGWPDSENSWEPEANLEHSQDVITEFYKAHPGAPRRLPSGAITGKPLTSKKRGKRKGRINELQFRPIRIQCNVEDWPGLQVSRGATP